jgi:hypothetical protein
LTEHDLYACATDMPAPPEDDDDFELELEPVDPEILELQRNRAQQKTDEVINKTTFEELHQNKPDDYDYDVDFSKLKEFRFTTRHLILVTTVVAIGLALWFSVSGCTALFVMGVSGVAAGWFFVFRAERQRAAELALEREKFYADRDARMSSDED